MGLYDGRGRWQRWETKPTVEEYRRLAVGELARAASLDRDAWLTWRWTWTGGQSDSIGITIRPGYGVRLAYRYGGEEDIAEDIAITYTTPNYGGRRPWWVCPGCALRVRYLYGGRVYRCRECHGLTYAIRRESKADAIRTAARNRKRRIAARLGVVGDVMPTAKPPRMRWRTYIGLVRDYRECAQVEDLALLAGIAGLLDPRGHVATAVDDVRAMWRYAKHPAPVGDIPPRVRRWLSRPRTATAPPVPLAALAQLAGVPADMAREAVRARLLRPDAGRGVGVGRYRPRLAGWLRKLYTLRAAGMPWADIRAWTRRRWDAGHEHERVWPEGYAPTGGEEGQE